MSSKITTLPSYISIVQSTSLDFYLKSTNLLNALENYLAEIQENIKFNKSLVTTNMLSSYGVLYNTLNETNFTVDNFKIENNKLGFLEPITFKDIGQAYAEIDKVKIDYNILQGIILNINEDEDVVSFETISKKIISKKIIEFVTVESKSGVQEKRPVVAFDILFKRKNYFNIPFVLADRSSSVHKVLLGKNFVKNIGDEIEPAGVKPLNNNFKLFFIEKYLSLSKEYKERVNALINNNKYFTDFSDDIGYIADPPSFLDNNVLPYYDVFNQQYFYAQNVPNTINKKISIEEKIMLKTFSFYTDSLLRLNLVGLQEGNITENTARTAHGQNLITDVLYYNRAVLNQQAFLSEIQVILGDISSFILFFKDLNPRDINPEYKAIFMKYTITNMENLEVKVDTLKNNLNKLSLSSKVVLGV